VKTHRDRRRQYPSFVLSEKEEKKWYPVLKASPKDNSESDKSPNVSNEDSFKIIDQQENEKLEDTITLYEILGAPATATRAELKTRYVELAKISHPDAQISSSSSSSSNSSNVIDGKVDFNEVAQAWRVLSDSKLRKKYDRELRAAAFSERAQAFANENLEKAVPAMADMVDIAAPFLRRTTVTTFAVGQAVAQGLNRGQPDGLSDTLKKAVRAGQDAGRVVDSIELSEKSQQLEERYVEDSNQTPVTYYFPACFLMLPPPFDFSSSENRAEKQMQRAQEIEEELDVLTEKRLLATLQSEDFFLSSDEANDVLNRLSIESTQSLVEKAMLRNTIEQDIHQLQVAEAKFSERLKNYEETDKEWNQLLTEEDEAKINLSEQKLQEIEARKALERAQRNVAEAKTQLVKSTNVLRGIEQQVRKSAFEMEKVTSTLSKKQERVRSVLKKKADLIKGGIQVEYLDEDELTSLRRKEIQLLGESKATTRMAFRLQSRAEKLKSRAQGLEAR
jgi:curved DNA-binding protein CbpA